MSAQACGGQIIVIGVGNDERGDDAVGLWVARRLKEKDLPGITTCELRSEATRLLDMWVNAGVVFLIDAVYSGAEPGTLHRLDGCAQRLGTTLLRLSTHGAGVANAVELGRVLGQFPARLLIYGIEGGCFAPGSPISPEVLKGADLALEAIIAELRDIDNVTDHA